ncbi:toll/interleukin-1 receptor domain-containing protein [Mesorhizobium sp. CA7]|uniref:toll/interleukin-1 receptor domain-containing protein n=1 Tax=Mesorhizobium sp. CA7 TaxID=588501 RepID=UPI001CCF07DC|nr:toll/interleukin-1 receptor domain-containing protein [Mesorhizobium sp. CA7]MBZ9814761.1 toll/interleukin-1 receptor domain-containing protein [Mesorhizobium sp. CA7]
MSDQGVMQEQVRIFCSYAREDADFLQAFLKGFSGINELVNHNIISFYDKDIGFGLGINDSIEKALEQSDILVILYTGISKKSYSYTGWEVGYFQALISRDIKERGESSRRIVSFFVDRPPAVTAAVLGISIGLERDELSLGKVAYLTKVMSELPERIDDNPITKFLFEVTQLAEKRAPSSVDPNTSMLRGAERIRKIKEEIYPALKGDIYDCISSRIAIREVEQLLIKFELPRSEAQAVGLPDDALLTHKGSSALGSLFGSDDEAATTWGAFKQQARKIDQPFGTILFAIERALESAVEVGRPVDNEQVVRSPTDGKLYRVIVTEQTEYYDGRRAVYLWFIPILSWRWLGNEETSMLLGFIVLAAKYRFLFLEEKSEYAIERAKKLSDMNEIKETIISTLRELVLIEEEARALKLDGAKAMLTIVDRNADMEEVSRHMAAYEAARQEVEKSANAIVPLNPASEAFGKALADWWSTLEVFVDASRVVNSKYTVSALENLKLRFVDTQKPA